LEARQSGKGQVVDAAMSDGAALLMSAQYGLMAKGFWSDERESNFLDGSAHFYATYECADGRYVSLGPIEPQFYRELLRKTGMEDPQFERQWESSAWPALKSKLSALFRTRDRDEWCRLLEGSDACFAPVLSMREAPLHPHNRARGSFVESGGVVQPAPAPRFGRTASELPAPAPEIGSDTVAWLKKTGRDDGQIAELIDAGVVHQAASGPGSASTSAL
jgi:alpha-methylacyl-CoA racemase